MMCIYDQTRRESEVGGKLPRAPRRLGAPPSARNIKYARMYHFWKEKFKKNFPEGPRENVCGPHANVSSGPAVALDGPVYDCERQFDPKISYWYLSRGLYMSACMQLSFWCGQQFNFLII